MVWDAVQAVQTLLGMRRKVDVPREGQNIDPLVLKIATSNLTILGEVSHAPSRNECKVFTTCTRSDDPPCSCYSAGAHGHCNWVRRGSGCPGVGVDVLVQTCALPLLTH